MTVEERGAYGLRLAGLAEAAALLGPAEDSWPRYEIAQEVGSKPLSVQTVGPDRAAIAPPSGGVILIER